MIRGRSRGSFGPHFGGLRDPRKTASLANGRFGGSRGGDPRILPPPFVEEERERPVRRRPPVAPVYEDGGKRFVMPLVQPPKLLRDRLYDKLCDWDFHSVAEFDKWMPEREWVSAMLALVRWGFAFDKDDRKLRLRKLRPGEPVQSVVDLLSGLTVPNRIVVPGAPVAGSPPLDVFSPDESQPFEPGSDAGETIPAEDEMVLDVEKTLVLSAPDFVTDTSAILARKGRGKTYLAMVIAEAFMQSSYAIPFVVIDPMGCWYGLLAKADGTPSEHSMVVFGGERGHYPLLPTSGRLMAGVVIAIRHLPTILDISAFSPSEQHRFVADFAEELYLRNRDAIHVFIDEADIFAPQRLEKASKHHARCLAAIDNLVRRGRFRGVGETLISQRPAVVNKNLLSQVSTMFFMQMIAPQDLDAVENWLHDNIPNELKEICRADLPILPMGTAYFLRAGEVPLFRRFKVKTKSSFDSSFTPKLGDKPKSCSLVGPDDKDRELIDDCLNENDEHDENEAVAVAPSPVSSTDPVSEETFPSEQTLGQVVESQDDEPTPEPEGFDRDRDEVPPFDDLEGSDDTDDKDD